MEFIAENRTVANISEFRNLSNASFNKDLIDFNRIKISELGKILYLQKSIEDEDENSKFSKFVIYLPNGEVFRSFVIEGEIIDYFWVDFDIEYLTIHFLDNTLGIYTTLGELIKKIYIETELSQNSFSPKNNNINNINYTNNNNNEFDDEFAVEASPGGIFFNEENMDMIENVSFKERHFLILFGGCKLALIKPFINNTYSSPYINFNDLNLDNIEIPNEVKILGFEKSKTSNEMKIFGFEAIINENEKTVYLLYEEYSEYFFLIYDFNKMKIKRKKINFEFLENEEIINISLNIQISEFDFFSNNSEFSFNQNIYKYFSSRILNNNNSKKNFNTQNLLNIILLTNKNRLIFTNKEITKIIKYLNLNLFFDSIEKAQILNQSILLKGYKKEECVFLIYLFKEDKFIPLKEFAISNSFFISFINLNYCYFLKNDCFYCLRIFESKCLSQNIKEIIYEFETENSKNLQNSIIKNYYKAFINDWKGEGSEYFSSIKENAFNDSETLILNSHYNENFQNFQNKKIETFEKFGNLGNSKLVNFLRIGFEILKLEFNNKNLITILKNLRFLFLYTKNKFPFFKGIFDGFLLKNSRIVLECRNSNCLLNFDYILYKNICIPIFETIFYNNLKLAISVCLNYSESVILKEKIFLSFILNKVKNKREICESSLEFLLDKILNFSLSVETFYETILYQINYLDKMKFVKIFYFLLNGIKDFHNDNCFDDFHCLNKFKGNEKMDFDIKDNNNGKESFEKQIVDLLIKFGYLNEAFSFSIKVGLKYCFYAYTISKKNNVKLENKEFEFFLDSLEEEFLKENKIGISDYEKKLSYLKNKDGVEPKAFSIIKNVFK